MSETKPKPKKLDLALQELPDGVVYYSVVVGALSIGEVHLVRGVGLRGVLMNFWRVHFEGPIDLSDFMTIEDKACPVHDLPALKRRLQEAYEKLDNLLNST